jgi:transposase
LPNPPAGKLAGWGVVVHNSLGEFVGSMLRSILKSGLDRAFLDETPDHQPLRHGNIRGQGYFH